MKNEINQLYREVSYSIMVTLSKKSGHDGMKYFNENIGFLLELSKKDRDLISSEEIDKVLIISKNFESMREHAKHDFLKFVLSKMIQELTHFIELIKTSLD